MKRASFSPFCYFPAVFGTVLFLCLLTSFPVRAADERRLPIKEFRDKMKGGLDRSDRRRLLGRPDRVPLERPDHPRGQDAEVEIGDDQRRFWPG